MKFKISILIQFKTDASLRCELIAFDPLVPNYKTHAHCTLDEHRHAIIPRLNCKKEYKQTQGALIQGIKVFRSVNKFTRMCYFLKVTLFIMYKGECVTF